MNISLAPELGKDRRKKGSQRSMPERQRLVHEAVERLVEADAEEHAHRNDIRKRIRRGRSGNRSWRVHRIR